MSRGRFGNQLYVTSSAVTPDELTQHVRQLVNDDDELTAAEVRLDLTDATIDSLAARRRSLADVLDKRGRWEPHQVARALAQFEQVTEHQDRLLAARLEVARFDPPTYLPPRPTNPLRRRAWVSTLVAVETYRGRWGIDDPDQPLGTSARSLTQASERAEVQRQLDDLTTVTTTPAHDVEPDVAAGLDL